MSASLKLPVTATVPLVGPWDVLSELLTSLGVENTLVRDGRATSLWLRRGPGVCGLQSSLERGNTQSQFGPPAVAHRGDVVVVLGELGAVVLTAEERDMLLSVEPDVHGSTLTDD